MVIFTLEGKIIALTERHAIQHTYIDKKTKQTMEVKTNIGWYVTLEFGKPDEGHSQQISFALGPDKPEPPFLIKIKAIE